MKNSQCSLSIGCLEKWKNILFRSLLYTIQITSYQKTSGLSAVPLLRQQVSIFINQRSFGQRERIVDTDDQNDHRDFFGKKFALCHLSQENNTPALALQTMFNTLGAAGVVPEKDCIVQAQRRNEISPTLTF